MNKISLPNLSASELVAVTKKDCDLTYVDSDYAKWDFYKGIDGKTISGLGKQFEVMTWKPEKSVTSEEVRAHFKEDGFSGHTGAFTAFVKEWKPAGYHASIPEDNGCWRDSDGRLCVPLSYFDGGLRRLHQDWLDRDWDSGWVFVAFRELPLDTQTLSTQESTLTLGLFIRACEAFVKVLKEDYSDKR